MGACCEGLNWTNKDRRYPRFAGSLALGEALDRLAELDPQGRRGWMELHSFGGLTEGEIAEMLEVWFGVSTGASPRPGSKPKWEGRADDSGTPLQAAGDFQKQPSLLAVPGATHTVGIAQACAGDAGLRRHVDQLLSADDETVSTAGPVSGPARHGVAVMVCPQCQRCYQSPQAVCPGDGAVLEHAFDGPQPSAASIWSSAGWATAAWARSIMLSTSVWKSVSR